MKHAILYILFWIAFTVAIVLALQWYSGTQL